MKTFLTNAFAVARLAAIQEFHLSHRSTNAPVSPSQSLPRVPKTNAIGPRSYSIIPCSAVQAPTARFEHSNFFKVKGPAAPGTQSRAPGGDRQERPGRRWARLAADRRPASPRSNYELFNCNNFNIRYWSWNYRGCWHQTCPPIDPRPRL